MSDPKQSSDAANSGVSVNKLTPNNPYVPAPKPTAQSPSGSSQSEKRGPQG